MTTQHGGSGNPLERDIEVTRETHKTADTDIENTQDFHPEEPDHFEDLQHPPLHMLRIRQKTVTYKRMENSYHTPKTVKRRQQ